MGLGVRWGIKFWLCHMFLPWTQFEEEKGSACSGAQSCPTLCNPVDSSPPGSSVHGIFQSRILNMGCHSLFQGIFLIQGLNCCLLHLLHWQVNFLTLRQLWKGRVPLNNLEHSFTACNNGGGLRWFLVYDRQKKKEACARWGQWSISKQDIYNKSGGSSNASEIINQLHYCLIKSGDDVSGKV